MEHHSISLNTKLIGINGESIYLIEMADSFTLIINFVPEICSQLSSIQLKKFKELKGKFTSIGFLPVFITDSIPENFENSYDLDVLVDNESTLARELGNLGKIGLISRKTYLMEPNGTIIKEIDNINPSKLAKDLLQVLSKERYDLNEPKYAHLES